MCVFGTTIAWSIYTTGSKARELLAKEKKAQDKLDGKDVGSTELTPILATDGDKGEEKTEFHLDFDADAHYSKYTEQEK